MQNMAHALCNKPLTRRETVKGIGAGALGLTLCGAGAAIPQPVNGDVETKQEKHMKVTLIIGSPRRNGNTARALKEVSDALVSEGLETETVWIGTRPVRGCIACGQCLKKSLGRCAFDDDVANEIVDKLKAADGIVIGAPTYYGQPNGAFLAVWQRICFAARQVVECKPAAAVAVCRRGGSTAAFQCLNMPVEMLNTPLAGSQYWNVVFGLSEGECEKDEEGMQTMRTLGRNLAWMVKNLRGANAVPRPPQEPWQGMNFIR